MLAKGFFVKTAITEALKFCFRALYEIAEETILQRSQLHGTKSLLWDANCELNALNPRLANLSSNRASNNAILTTS